MKSGSTVKAYREYKQPDSNVPAAKNFSIKYSIEKVDKVSVKVSSELNKLTIM